MNVETARPLPQSPEAESAILGGCMADTPGIEEVFIKLDADDFFDTRNRIVFVTLREIRREGKPTNNPNVLVDALRSSGRLDAVGLEYVAAIGDGVPRIQPLDQHIAALRRTKFLRRMIHLGELAHQPHGERVFPELVQLAANVNLCSVNGTSSEPPGWREVFHSVEDFETSRGLRDAIEGFLQIDSATMIAGLSGHAKTFIMLSMTRSLLSGHKLWNQFEVKERAARVIYLIPESSIDPFKHRLELFGLMEHVRNERLLIRTLSKGSTPSLSDQRILFAAKGADVFLDTAVRFSTEGSENDASDNQRGLASDIFSLLGAGARLVVGAHHAPKSFARETVMSLENVLRGSGDIGAMLGTCWGVRQIDADQNVVYVQNVKARDFEPCRPFQLVGRPFIDTEGDFRMHKLPGESGFLQELLEAGARDQGGARPESRQERARRIAMIRDWLTENPDLTRNDVVLKLGKEGIDVKYDTARRYLEDARAWA